MGRSLIKRVWLFYYEGFRSMTLGKTLWVIILIKLFILFFVFKLFFFKDALGSYKTEEDKSQHIINELTIDKR
jgi:hypothetical protein